MAKISAILRNILILWKSSHFKKNAHLFVDNPILDNEPLYWVMAAILYSGRRLNFEAFFIFISNIFTIFQSMI